MLEKNASEDKDILSAKAAREAKLPLCKRVVSVIAAIENLAFLSLKTVVVLMLLIMIWKMALWVCAEDKGVVIQPFDIDGIGNGLDGKSIAQLLGCELQKIQEIDQQAETIGIPRDFQIEDEAIAATKSARNTPSLKKPYGEDRIPEIEMTSSLAGSNPQSDFGFLFLKGESLQYTISSMGSLGFGGASLPAGNLLLFLKELVGSTSSTIEGSIQKYNSTIIIVATMEDHRSSDRGIVSWDLRKNVTVDNNSLNDQIPLMIKDLSFRIALDLARRWQSEKDFPRSWKSLKYLIMSQEQFINYNRTGISEELGRSRDLAIEAMKSDPGYDKTLGLLSKQALIYLGNDNGSEAEGIFHTIKKFRPFEGSVGLGLVFSNTGRYEEACREYDEALRINKSLKSTWFNRGKALRNQGKIDEAIKSYDEALRIDPNYVKAWNGKGLALSDQGKLDEAIKSYDEALRINPDYINALNNKGNALLKDQNRLDEAIESYEKALKIDPNYVKAWNGKGAALKAQGRLDEAIKSYDEAIKIDPDYAYAWHNKGNVLLKNLSTLNEAVKSYDEALRIDPGYFNAWNNKGIALKTQGKLDEAIKSYEEALKIEPNYANAWYNKGEALRAQGKLKEAIKSYDEALKIDPSNINVRNSKDIAIQVMAEQDQEKAEFK
jgi:tetratricopeptide (TPR) repeat protein